MVDIEALQKQYEQHKEALRKGFFKPQGRIWKRLKDDFVYEDVLANYLKKYSTLEEVVKSSNDTFFQRKDIILGPLFSITKKWKEGIEQHLPVEEIITEVYGLDEEAGNAVALLAYDLNFYDVPKGHLLFEEEVPARAALAQFLGTIKEAKAQGKTKEEAVDYVVNVMNNFDKLINPDDALEAMQGRYSNYMSDLREAFFRPQGWIWKRYEEDENYFGTLAKILNQAKSYEEVVGSSEFKRSFEPYQDIVQLLWKITSESKIEFPEEYNIEAPDDIEFNTSKLFEILYDLKDDVRNHVGLIVYELGYYNPDPSERAKFRERFVSEEYINMIGVDVTAELLIQLAITNTLGIISELRKNNVPKDKAVLYIENTVKKTYEEGRDYLKQAMSPSQTVVAEGFEHDSETLEGNLFDDSGDTFSDSKYKSSPRVFIITPLTRYQSIVTMIEDKDYEDAESKLGDIISKLMHPHGALFYQRAKAVLGKGDTEAAKRDLERALVTQFIEEYGIQRQDAYIALAEIHVSEGDNDEAFYVFEEGQDACKDSSDKITKRLEALLQYEAEKTLMGDELPQIDEGAAIETAVKTNVTRIDSTGSTTTEPTILKKTQEPVEDDMYSSAIKIYEQQIKAEPDNPQNHFNILETLLPYYSKLPDNHRQTALRALNSAIALNSGDKLVQMAETYYHEGQNSAAEVILGTLHWDFNYLGDKSLYAKVIRRQNSDNNPIIEMFAKYIARE